jgi:hypothetical protein
MSTEATASADMAAELTDGSHLVVHALKLDDVDTTYARQANWSRRLEAVGRSRSPINAGSTMCAPGPIDRRAVRRCGRHLRQRFGHSTGTERRSGAC